MIDTKTAEYITSLPEIDTARLPQGTLFWAENRLYQVIETGASGYHKAREWRKPDAPEVALVAGSFLSKYLPLIKRGRVLPVYKSRLELTYKDQPTCFVFPAESLALDAAYLDVALLQNSGAYVRNQGREPAFAVTDGVHIFRLYYYRTSAHGRKTDLSGLQVRPLPFLPRYHTDGPAYWRLLSHWAEENPMLEVTQQMKPISNSLLSEDTIPHIPTVPPQR
ncbi:MAG: hypothetical protein HY866_01015 [Chloroflexi bacterium]|nr:hypothetical protein [Chloroflexota bacterium]